MTREEAARRIAVYVVSCKEYEDFDESELTRTGRIAFLRALGFGGWIIRELLPASDVEGGKE